MSGSASPVSPLQVAGGCERGRLHQRRGKRLRRERIDPGRCRRDRARDLLRHVVGRNLDGAWLRCGGFRRFLGLAGSLAGSAGEASTFGRAEVVAGSARCFGKIGAGCTTSTSIAGGALLPGPGSVISIGSMAATQSPCTAPAPSTQSGRVIERLSVKGRSFRGAAALPPPTSASS